VEINARSMDLLYRVGSTKFQKAFNPAKQFAIESGLCEIYPTTTLELDQFWLARLPVLREWLGAKIVNAISAHSQKLVMKNHELTFSVDRNHIKYDQFNMFNFALDSATERANKLVDYAVADILRSNPTTDTSTGLPLYYDGQPFFSTAHPITGNTANQDPQPTALTGAQLVGTTDATAAALFGSTGTLYASGSALTLILNVNGAGAVTLTFTAASAATVGTMLAQIQATWPALTQVTIGGSSGRALVLTASSSIAVGNGTANTALGYTNLEAGTGVSTQSNLALSTPLSHSSYSAAYETMLNYVDEQGRPWNVVPDTLFVGPHYRRIGKEILEESKIANVSLAAGSNTVMVQDNAEQGTAKLVIVPEFNYSPGMWILASTKGPLKPFMYGQLEAPHMIPCIDPTSPNVFLNRQFMWSIEEMGNIIGTLWPLAYYGNASATFGG